MPLAIVIAVAAFVLLREDDGGDRAAGPRGTEELDVAVTPLQGRPSAIAAAGGRLWVTDDERALVVPLDPADGAFAGDAVEVAEAPVAIAAAGDDELWVAHAGGQITRIAVDDEGGTADQSIQVGGTLIAVAVEGDAVWVGDINGRAVRRVDRRTGELGEPIVVRDGVVRLTTDGAGGLWVSNLEDTVVRVDTETGALGDRVSVGAGPIGMAVVGDQLWVANSDSGTVSRVELASGDPAGDEIEVGEAPIAIANAVDGDGAWVLNQDDETVTRLDRSGRPVGDDVGLGTRPRGLVVTPTGVWAAGVDPSAAVLVSRRRS